MPTPVGQWAAEHHLPLLSSANINIETLPQADLMVVIAFGQKISPAMADHARLGSINLHASLLPKYRGAAPINWAIARGETVTGNSVIRLAQKMDAGAVLGQTHVQIGPVETAGELHDRLAKDGALLMQAVLAALTSGSAVETAQDEALATLAPKLSRHETALPWELLPADEVAWRIRGFSPWPGCHVRLVDAQGAEQGRLALIRARAVDTDAVTTAPGIINSSLQVAAADAGRDRAVEIMEIKPEGRGVMPLSAYRNGHPWQAGWKLESIV
jgi:methionyl-tRNA formyltransferase